MTWAEVLAVFNFIAWLLPILIRSYMAWKYDSISKHNLSDTELESIRKSVGKINFKGGRLDLSDNGEKPREIQGRNK